MKKILNGYISVMLCALVIISSIFVPAYTFADTTSSETKGLIGDLDGDGEVTVLDFALMKQYLFGDITDFPVEDDIWAGDLDGNGEIDSLDFSLMKQYLLRIIDYFPKEQSSQTATPTFNPIGGTYATAQTVAISCMTTGASIYYTTDGSIPTTNTTNIWDR